jgi:hypothetical protein
MHHIHAEGGVVGIIISRDDAEDKLVLPAKGER